MKTIFIFLKIFLSSAHVKKALQQFSLIFFVVFLFILGSTIYYVYLHQPNVSDFRKKLLKTFAEPRNFNTNVGMSYDSLPLKEIELQLFYDENFWQPEGLDTRYTIPKDGKPTNQ
ncbi:MAG: hypothetical protein ACRCVW_06465 [Brevinema sp.]